MRIARMVMEGRDGGARVLNAVIDEGAPIRERVLASHVGIFSRK